jgi:hypothetical protein
MWWEKTEAGGWDRYKKLLCSHRSIQGMIAYEFPIWYVIDDSALLAGIPLMYVEAFREASPDCVVGKHNQILPWVDPTWSTFSATYAEMTRRYKEVGNEADEMLRHYDAGCMAIVAEMRAGVRPVRYEGILLERFADAAQVTIEHLPLFCRQLGYTLHRSGVAFVIVEREEEGFPIP